MHHSLQHPNMQRLESVHTTPGEEKKVRRHRSAPRQISAWSPARRSKPDCSSWTRISRGSSLSSGKVCPPPPTTEEELVGSNQTGQLSPWRDTKVKARAKRPRGRVAKEEDAAKATAKSAQRICRVRKSRSQELILQPIFVLLHVS